MYKAASKKISIFLTGFILLAWAAFGPASPCSAGMQELSDGQMAAVYATGFSTFSLTGDTARVDFNNVILSTWTEIESMKMGYYNNEQRRPGTTTGQTSPWERPARDLVAQGLFIEAKFTNITDPATRTAGIRPHRDDQSDRGRSAPTSTVSAARWTTVSPTYTRIQPSGRRRLPPPPGPVFIWN